MGDYFHKPIESNDVDIQAGRGCETSKYQSGRSSKNQVSEKISRK